jgi:hypothetical protein
LFDDPKTILADETIQSFLAQCDEEKNNLPGNTTQSPLFSQRRKKYLLDKVL